MKLKRFRLKQFVVLQVCHLFDSMAKKTHKREEGDESTGKAMKWLKARMKAIKLEAKANIKLMKAKKPQSRAKKPQSRSKAPQSASGKVPVEIQCVYGATKYDVAFHGNFVG